MAMQENEAPERSLKDLKKMMKEQKKSKKKTKKKEKLERKIAKKEAKMRKKGVFLPEVAPPEGAPIEEKPQEFVTGPWVRKSTETMPYVERKIDRMAERRERSSLHGLFEEKYGESLMIPTTYKEYELTEAEKARLKELGVGVEEVEAPSPIEVAPIEGAPVKAEEGIEIPEGGEVTAGEEVETEAEAAVKPFYYPFHLWLYTKYGKDKMIVLKILILIVSVLGFVILLIPRIIIFLIMTLVKKMKQRKVKKAEKAEEAKKAATEA